MATSGAGPTDQQKALMEAIEKKDVDAVRGFLQDDVDVNFCGDNGDTPLHLAVKCNAFAIVSELMETGADVSSRNNEGKTPLECATGKVMRNFVAGKVTSLGKFTSRVSENMGELEELFNASGLPEAEEEENLIVVDQEEKDSMQEREELFRRQPFLNSDRNLDNSTQSPDRKKAYEEIFSLGNPYEMLAKVIKHQNEVESATIEGKTANLQRRLKNIIPAVQFAVQGAREEYRVAFDAKNKKDEQVSSNDDEAREEQKKLDEIKAKMELFEEIQDMLISLRSLTKNRSRYTQAHFEMRLKKLKDKLGSKGVVGAEADALIDALTNVAENNTFNKRKFYQSDKLGMGSTPFDATQDSMQIGDIRKRVKIEHSGKGEKVSAIFSYSRNKLLGQSSGKIWKTRKGEFKIFNLKFEIF